MKTTLLCVFLGLCTIASTQAQPSESLKSSAYFHRLTRALLKNGTVKSGWFVGTDRDSLVIQIGSQSERLSRQDLLRVTIDAAASTGAPALVGMVSGAYLGSALVLRGDNQPFLFVAENRGVGEVLLYNALFSLVGGALGYLVGSLQSNEVVFDLSGTEEERSARWEDLCKGGQKAGREGSVHLSFQGSWVSGPVPEGRANDYYYGQNVNSLNMMRKLQLTYTMTDFADVGLAFMWLGQPSHSYYSPDNNTIGLSGSGYYAVGVFKPLWTLGMHRVQWDIGLGVGLTSVNFSVTPNVYYYYYPPPSSPGTAIALKKTTFSAMTYTELKVFFADYFSVGLTADLVYIPETIPAVKGIAFERETFGTTSVGFVVGYHF
jgi:hypothetical protein